MKVPKLRFKEFSDSWEEKTLEELGEFKNGVNKGKDDFGSGYPFVNLLDIFGKNSIDKNENLSLVKLSNKELEEFNLLKGDILFVRSSVKPEGVGLTTVILNDLENTVYSGFIIRFRENKKILDLNYKKYCFYIENFRKNLLNKSTVSANTNINQDSLKNLIINFPSLEEQEKIGNFLSSIDKKISLTEEKLNLFKSYKKGMMQKIFKQEIRFKDENGQDYPDWVEKRLGDIGKFFSGGTPKSGNKEYYNGNIPFIKSGEIYKDETEQYISKLGLENSSAKMVNKGDLLFALYGATSGECAISKINGAINQAILVIRTEENNIFLLNTFKYYKNQIINKFLQGGQGNLSAELIKMLIFKFPCLEEQEKIAKFLSSIDNKIENLSNELENLRDFKKGLLQKMFI